MAAPKLTSPLEEAVFWQTFAENTRKTFQCMAQLEIAWSPLSLNQEWIPQIAIAGVVPLHVPPWKALCATCFSEPTILVVVNEMLGESYSSLVHEVQDTVGEITNQIYGASKTDLNQKGFQLEMASPKVMLAPHRLQELGLKFHVITFQLRNGKFPKTHDQFWLYLLTN